MEQSVIFTINNGVAQSADGSVIWTLQPPSGQQHHLREQEEAEFLDDWSDDDDDLTLSQLMAMGYINRVRTINDPAWARVVDFQDLSAHHRRQEAHGGAGEVGDDVVFVPASDAAVAGLEKKQAFRATAEGYDDHECGGGVTTGCAICLEDFEEGEEVTVMPCFHGHEFHPDCIAKWLGKSNTCPLCRHALPTDDAMDDDGL